MKVSSMIVFCDVRKTPLAGLSESESLELCRDLTEYACFLAHERGVKAVSVFDLLPEGSISPATVHTAFLSENLIGAVSDELGFMEAVAVIEHLGAASAVPADLKAVCDEQFRTVKPFSWFFDPKVGDNFRREMLRQHAQKEKPKGRAPENLMRGGRRR